jgi:hypothetical protein
MTGSDVIDDWGGAEPARAHAQQRARAGAPVVLDTRHRLHREHIARLRRLGVIDSKPKLSPVNTAILERSPLPVYTALLVRRKNFETVKCVVAAHYNMSVAELIGQGRTARFVVARQMAIYVMREMYGSRIASYGRIGLFLGGRDHSTVMHAYHSINRMANANPPFARVLRDILCACQQRVEPWPTYWLKGNPGDVQGT